MADLEPVNGKVSLTADTSGADQATSSVNSFSSSLSNLESVAAGLGLERLGEQFLQVGEQALSAVADFQTNTVAIQTVLDNVGNAPVMQDSAGGGGGAKASDIANQRIDEMINYKEKMASIQDDIATVMKGQNVIDATDQMNQKIEDLTENHIEKIDSLNDQILQTQQNLIDKEAAMAQNEADTLQDLQDTHDDTMANKKEKFDQDMSNAQNSVQKMVIQKKYDDEVKLAEDSYQRQYDLKKKELDRNNAEQKTADEKAASEKIQSLNDQITKENASYDKQNAKIIADGDAQVAKDKADNDKKLLQYKQELDDEERLHAEHLQKLAEQASSGGGGSGSFTSLLPRDSEFANTKEKFADVMGFINNFSETSPFNLADITESTRKVESMGYSAKALIPIISDISAGTGKTFGTTTQALLDGLNGRVQMMEQELGVSKEKLIEFGAEYDKQGHLLSQQSLVEAFKNLANSEYIGASQKALHTFNGALSNVQDGLLRTALGFGGIDAASGVTANGPLKTLTEILVAFGNYLNKNQPAIKKALSETAGGLIVLAAAITVFVLPAMLRFVAITGKEAVVALWNFGVAGWQLIPMLGLLATGQDTAAIAAGTLTFAELGMATIMGGIVLLAIAAVIAIGYELITHWSQVEKIATQVWNTIGNVIKSNINQAIQAINMLITGLNGLLGAAHISTKIPIIQELSMSTNGISNIGSDFSDFKMNPLESAIANMGAGGQSPNQSSTQNISNPITIINNNNIKNTADLSALQKQLGVQLSLAR